MPKSILAQAVAGLENIPKEAGALWAHCAADIAADIAAVEKAIPGSAPAINALGAKVKQGTSDALGIGAVLLGDAQPVLISGAEGVLDAALLKLTGGAATPALPGVNAWTAGLVQQLISAAEAWLLKQQAMTATAMSAAKGGQQ